MTSAIYCVLPARERFRPADAGAVALCVKEQIQLSNYGQQSVVIGGLEGGFEGIRYQEVVPRWSWLLGKSMAYSMACCQYLKAQMPALIEVHNRAVLFLAIQRILPQVPCCLFLHNDPQNMDGCKSIKQRQQLLNKAAIIYCVSDFVKQRFLHGVTGDISKVKVIYNGVNTPAVMPPKQKIISYAGRLIPEKGILELVQAMAGLLPQYPEWRFEVIGAYGFGRPLGATDFEQQLFAAAQSANTQITFLGHQPQPTVMEHLSKSALVVVASTGIDAFPRVPIEAMAQGCAIITSASGGLKEVTFESPYCVTTVTSNNLLNAIQPLLADGAQLKQAQQWSQQQVTKFSSIEQVAKLDRLRAALVGGHL